MPKPQLKVIQGGNLTPDEKRQRKQFRDELRKRMLNAAEVNAMLKRYGIKIDGLPLNTLGHAHRMFRLAEDKVLAQTTAKGQRAQWVVYVDEFGYWTIESATLVAEGYVVAVGDLLRTWAEQLQERLEDPKPKKPLTVEQQIELIELIEKLHAEANKLQGSGRGSVLSMAMVRKPEAFMDHHLNEALFDADPDHLVVKNGVIDLRTGRRVDHHPKFKMTRHIDVDYIPAALKRTDSKFLDLVIRMFPEPGLLQFVQKLSGYFTTGHVSEQVALVFLGPTGTGKSTFWKAVANTLGETHRGGYTTPATAGLLRVKSAHWGDTSTIEHARILIDSETGEDTILDPARLKRLTGEQSITVNAKYGKHRTIAITGKIVLQTNHPPVFAGSGDEAVYRRMFIIPCNVQMYQGGWDEGTYLAFEQALKEDAEREVVLAWLIEGAKAWYRSPLRTSVPECVEEQLKALRARSGDGDPIQDAITNAGYEITFDHDSDFVVAAELIAVVQAARPAITRTAIGLWCIDHGLQATDKTVDYNGKRSERRVYTGIRRKP